MKWCGLMYEIMNGITNSITVPLSNVAISFKEVTLLYAFLLGIVGSMVPCQLTGNIGALTLFGKKSLDKQVAWGDVILFTLGKIVAFTSLGLLIWLFGREIQSSLTLYFPWIRKLTGPLLIVVGLFLLGYLKMNWYLPILNIADENIKSKKWGSFLLGFSFSLGFCPTMFVLFFLSLMPVALTESYGMVLPSVFAVGTTVPIFILMFLIWFFEAGGMVMKRGKRVGSIIQKVAGAFLVVLGIWDTLTYWTI